MTETFQVSGSTSPVSARRQLSTCIATLLVLLSLSSFSLGCSRLPPSCSSENLIDPDTPLQSYGVLREQWMVDGFAPEPGDRLNDFVAAHFVSSEAHVTYDLGRVARVGAFQIVTNNRAADLVSYSVDGLHYSNLDLESEAKPGRSGQLFVRYRGAPELRFRYLKIAMQPQHRGRAVAEVRASCSEPSVFPLRLEAPEAHKQRGERLLERGSIINGARVGLALTFLVLLLGFGRKFRAYPRAVATACIVVGALAWLRFGDLVGDGQSIHPWDAMHYYLGAKYFPELGYTELYRCIARYERERGRGAMVDRGTVRDLDNYVSYPGTWTATPDGACRARFSPERWLAFGEDVDRLRRSFVISRFHATLKDHGYNATPLQTAWLRPLADNVPSTRFGLRWLATLDLVAIAVASAALWWAFGPLAAGLGMLVLGLGTPWSVLWVGGSLGRFAWLALLCAGLACLKKERFVSGAALVTLSGLLRLFPLVFLVTLLLKVGVDAFRDRKLGSAGKRVLVGVALAALLGSLAVVLQGVDGLAEFVENSALHARVPPKANHLGLGVVASLGSGDSVLEAFRQGGRTAEILAGSLLWVGGVLLAAIFVLGQAWRSNRSTWEVVCIGAPLLFASIPLAGYDYAWLIVLVPMAVASSPRIAMLLAGLAAVDLCLWAGASMIARHVAASVVIGVLLVAIFWHERRAKGPAVLSGRAA